MSNLSVSQSSYQPNIAEPARPISKREAVQTLKSLGYEMKQDAVNLSSGQQFAAAAFGGIAGALSGAVLFNATNLPGSEMAYIGSAVAGGIAGANMTDTAAKGSLYGAAAGALIGGAVAGLTSGADVRSILQGAAAAAVGGAVGGFSGTGMAHID